MKVHSFDAPAASCCVLWKSSRNLTLKRASTCKMSCTPHRMHSPSILAYREDACTRKLDKMNSNKTLDGEKALEKGFLVREECKLHNHFCILHFTLDEGYDGLRWKFSSVIVNFVRLSGSCMMHLNVLQMLVPHFRAAYTNETALLH